MESKEGKEEQQCEARRNYHSFLLSLETPDESARSKDILKQISRFCMKKAAGETGRRKRSSEKQLLKFGAQRTLEVIRQRQPVSLSEVSFRQDR